MRWTILLFPLLVALGQAAVVPSLVPKTPYPTLKGGKIEVVDVPEGKLELERFGKMLLHFHPEFGERENRPRIRVDSSPPIAAAPQLHVDVGPLIESAIARVGFINAVPWDDKRGAALGAAQAQPQVFTLPRTQERMTISADGILDLPSLAAILASKTNALSLYLLSRFTETTRQLIPEYLNDSTKGSRLLGLLVTEFNFIIEGESIFETSRFEHVALRNVTLTLIRNTQERSKKDSSVKIQYNDTSNLNRILLEDAFPVQLAREHSVRVEEARIDANWQSHPYLRRWSVTPFVIYGAFTRYDERIDTQNRSAEASLYFDFGGGTSGTPKAFSSDIGVEFENELTGIGLTIKAAQNEGAEIIPGCVVDSTGVVAKAKRKQNYGFFFFGNGLNFAGQATRANGVHEVCTRMVDRSTLAILGKFFRIPYWRCIRNGQLDPSVMDLIKEEFKYGFGSDKEQRKFEQLRELVRLLGLNGYTLDSTIDSKTFAAVDRAIEDYCKKHKLPTLKDGNDITDQYAGIYAHLHVTAPIPGFPDPDQQLASFKNPESGVMVEFNGFPLSYKDALYKLLVDSNDVRAVSELPTTPGFGTSLRFKADMYIDDAKRLSKHIESAWPKRKLESRENCETEVVNDRYVRVYFKTGRVRRDVGR